MRSSSRRSRTWSPFSTSAIRARASSQNLKWRRFKATRSVAISSTSFSAARRSTARRSSSQPSVFLQAAMVCGLTLRCRAISMFESASLLRKSARAFSRTFGLARGMRAPAEEVFREVREPPSLPISAGNPVRCALDGRVDEVSLLMAHDEMDYDG